MTATRRPRSVSRPVQPSLEKPADAELDTEGAAIASHEPPTDSVQSLMAELAGTVSAKVTVYRAGKNQQLAYVFQCHPDAFSLDDLRDRYNGGTFRLFISSDGVLRRNVTVEVEPRQRVGEVAAEAPSAVAELAATMREGFALQAAAMRELATKAAAPQPSPFAGLNITEIVGAVSTVITTLRTVAAPPPQPQTAGIDMLLKGIELAKELRGEGGDGGEPGMMSILRDLIKSPMLAQAVMATAQPQISHAQQPRTQAQPQILQPQPMQAQMPANQAAETSSAPAIDPQVAEYINMLIGRAEAGADPQLYADLIADMLPDEGIRQILSLPPTPADFLASNMPQTAPHKEWFVRLANELREIVDEGINGEATQVVAESANATDAAQTINPVGPTT